MSNPEGDLSQFINREGKNPDDVVSVVMAGVHGNETAGIKAFDILLPELNIEHGTVIFAYGNPRAMAEGTRFSSGGANLNGLFRPDEELTEKQRRSYEYERAQQLKPVLLRAGALNDIHGTQNPNSVKFVIAEPGKPLEIARRLPFDIISSGYDEWQPGGTDHFMNANGRIGICSETGPNNDPRSVDVAIRSITDFLVARGHVTGQLQERENQRHIAVKEMHIAKDEFRYVRQFPEFAPVRKGDLIGMEAGQEIKASGDGYLIFTSQMVVPVGDEAFLFGQDAPLT